MQQNAAHTFQPSIKNMINNLHLLLVICSECTETLRAMRHENHALQLYTFLSCFNKIIVVCYIKHFTSVSMLSRTCM